MPKEDLDCTKHWFQGFRNLHRAPFLGRCLAQGWAPDNIGAFVIRIGFGGISPGKIRALIIRNRVWW